MIIRRVKNGKVFLDVDGWICDTEVEQQQFGLSSFISQFF